MSLEDDIATLGRAPLFHLLDRDALRLLAFASENRELEEGEVLFQAGERSDGGYVVSYGALVLEAQDGNAAPFVATPGSLIGQAALFATVERPATATAREASEVMRISPAVMRRMLREFPQSAAAMQDSLAGDLAELTEGLEQVRRRLLAIDEKSA
jgi:CRP-like cAMP-binding protein